SSGGIADGARAPLPGDAEINRRRRGKPIGPRPLPPIGYTPSPKARFCRGTGDGAPPDPTPTPASGPGARMRSGNADGRFLPRSERPDGEERPGKPCSSRACLPFCGNPGAGFAWAPGPPSPDPGCRLPDPIVVADRLV